MIPPTKILSLCIRLFSKPVAGVLKSSYKNCEDKPLVNRWFILFGRKAYAAEVGVRDKVMGKSSRVRWIADDKALEIGVEYFCEAVVYAFLLLWGGYEFWLYRREAELQEIRHSESVLSIFNKIEKLDQDFKQLESKFKVGLDD